MTSRMYPDIATDRPRRGAGASDLVADVAGYFTDGDLGSRYQPLAPAHAMDTRYGTGVRKGR
ncbi:hypothetical protein ACFW6K_24445 [Streptomyces sp. NPDC058733]|uniref:hypothetical protein n=1 Tax=unclassified Streptomyces TaxID=2593676 RepID=UPI003452FE53